MSAMCVPWYVSCADMGVSKHRDAVFVHFCPLNQNLGVGASRGGNMVVTCGCVFSVIRMVFGRSRHQQPDHPLLEHLLETSLAREYHTWCSRSAHVGLMS